MAEADTVLPQTTCTDAVAPRLDSGACDGVQDRTAGPVGGGCQHGRRLLKAAIAFKAGLRSRLAGQVRMQHFRPELRKPSAAGRFRQRGRKALPAISRCNLIDAATRCCENRRVILRRPAAPEAARIRCGYEAPHSHHHRPSGLPHANALSRGAPTAAAIHPLPGPLVSTGRTTCRFYRTEECRCFLASFGHPPHGPTASPRPLRNQGGSGTLASTLPPQDAAQ